MIISRLLILYWHLGLEEESLIKVSFNSNNSDTSKIHSVVGFLDMAEDLGVMVDKT